MDCGLSCCSNQRSRPIRETAATSPGRGPKVKRLSACSVRSCGVSGALRGLCAPRTSGDGAEDEGRAASRGASSRDVHSERTRADRTMRCREAMRGMRTLQATDWRASLKVQTRTRVECCGVTEQGVRAPGIMWRDAGREPKQELEGGSFRSHARKKMYVASLRRKGEKQVLRSAQNDKRERQRRGLM